MLRVEVTAARLSDGVAAATYGLGRQEYDQNRYPSQLMDGQPEPSLLVSYRVVRVDECDESATAEATKLNGGA